MKIHSLEFVHRFIQPVLNDLGGEIYGGFVRDLVVEAPFKDVDINYPYGFSEKNLKIFLTALRNRIGSDYEVGEKNTKNAYDEDGREVLRSKIIIRKLVDSWWRLNPDELEIDLIWDSAASNDLDVDIHALYLDRSWKFQIYNQPKYRNALVNAKQKQFIVLNASPRRIKKLIKKGYKQFSEGFLSGLWEQVTDEIRMQEYENPLYLDSEVFSQLKIGSNVFIRLNASSQPYLAGPEAPLTYRRGPLPGLYPCEVVQIEEKKAAGFEEKRALILVPKGTGFKIEPNEHVVQVETVQCDGYYVRARGQNGTQDY